MCEHCQLMENCVNCHYNDNYTKSICVKCSNNYYIIQMENVKNVNMNIMMIDIAIFAQKMELIMNHVLAGVGILKLEIIIVLDVMIDVKNVIISKKQMILNVYHVIQVIRSIIIIIVLIVDLNVNHAPLIKRIILSANLVIPVLFLIKIKINAFFALMGA